jgi:hypothetical protein
MHKINTFDVFDTLIARRCIFPLKIFELVEKKSGFANFAQMRRNSELKIISGVYTLQDIYAHLSMDYGVDPATARTLMEMEIAAELENVIPIKENLEMVKDGDLLISDMYLPKEVILKLLAKSGLNKEVELIVTNHGKGHGYIWPDLQKNLHIGFHLGDNPHADLKSPQASGVRGEIVNQWALTNHEQFVFDNGYQMLAQLAREVRLGTQTLEHGLTRHQEMSLQYSHNIPILIMAACSIYKYAAESGIDNILFSGRDCFFLKKYYDAIFNANWNFTTHYFYTSRISRMKGSESYEKYFKNLMNGSTLVVDLCGTGWSLSRLYAKVGLSPRTYLIQYDQDNKIYDPLGRDQDQYKFDYLNINIPAKNIILEMLNQVDHGMLEDVIALDGYNAFIPVFEETDYPKPVADFVGDIRMIHEYALKAIDSFDGDALVGELLGVAEKNSEMVKLLSIDLNEKRDFLKDIDAYHTRHNNHTLHLMQLPPKN